MPRTIAFDVDELRSLRLPAAKGCDFCATDLPAWRYPACEIGLGTIVYGDTITRPVSLGGWCACQECSNLVEAGDWPALARRTLRSLSLDLSQAGPGTRVRLLVAFHHAHEQFRRARNGPRETVS
jgi:hypothetical protein